MITSSSGAPHRERESRVEGQTEGDVVAAAERLAAAGVAVDVQLSSLPARARGRSFRSGFVGTGARRSRTTRSWRARPSPRVPRRRRGLQPERVGASLGRAVSAFSPGTLLTAIRRESLAVAKQAGAVGGVRDASTRTTALSQHCLCGARVEKSLGERIHRCTVCGLQGDRDAVSAALASFVEFTTDEESSAFVDYVAARALLGERTTKIFLDTLELAAKGRQDAPSESTAPSALDGSSVEETGRTSRNVTARRNAGTAPRATPNETGAVSRTKSELSGNGEKKSTPLRDSS